MGRTNGRNDRGRTIRFQHRIRIFSILSSRTEGHPGKVTRNPNFKSMRRALDRGLMNLFKVAYKSFLETEKFRFSTRVAVVTAPCKWESWCSS